MKKTITILLRENLPSPNSTGKLQPRDILIFKYALADKGDDFVNIGRILMKSPEELQELYKTDDYNFAEDMRKFYQNSQKRKNSEKSASGGRTFH